MATVSQLLFQETLCWFSYSGLVCVPKLVLPQYFLYQVSIQCVQVTLGLQTGYLPSRSSRAQLPLQVQSTKVKEQRNETATQSRPLGMGGWDCSWRVNVGRLSGHRLWEEGIHLQSHWVSTPRVEAMDVGTQRQVLSSFPRSPAHRTILSQAGTSVHHSYGQGLL